MNVSRGHVSKLKKPTKIALVIGHRLRRQGAQSCLPDYMIKERSEYQINKLLVESLFGELWGLSSIWQPYFIRGNLTLKEKCKLANDYHTEIVLELHCNSFRDSRAGGTEMLYCGASSKGKMLASFLQEETCKVLKLKDRGIKPRKRSQRGGYLLWKTQGVAIITEPLFLSNPLEANLLRYKVMRNEIVGGYFRGLTRYRRWLDNNY